MREGEQIWDAGLARAAITQCMFPLDCRKNTLQFKVMGYYIID